MNILVINCGSSSIKAAVVDASTGASKARLRVERIGQHRRAEQVTDLAAGHPDGRLVDVFGLEQVALLDVRPVDAAARAQQGRGKQGSEEYGAVGRGHAG